jgi:hypothetical protein
LTDLSHRKQKLIDEVAVLNTQTNNAINEYERLVKEIAVFLLLFNKLDGFRTEKNMQKS